MPWPAWSSPCWRMSRLYCSAAEASSSSLKAASVREVAPPQQQRQHQPRGGRADRRGQQMLAEAQQWMSASRLGVGASPRPAGEALEGALGPLLPEIAADGRLQLGFGDAGAPEREGLRHRGAVGCDEGVGLQPLHRIGRAQQREADIGQDVEAQAPDDAMGQRIGRSSPSRASGRNADRPSGPWATMSAQKLAGLDQARHQQRIGPGRDADDQPGRRAQRRAAPPDQPAEEGRRDLRRRGEGEQADRDQRRLAGRPVIGVAEQDHDQDRDAPDDHDLGAEIAAGRAVRLRLRPHQRRRGRDR